MLLLIIEALSIISVYCGTGWNNFIFGFCCGAWCIQVIVEYIDYRVKVD